VKFSTSCRREQHLLVFRLEPKFWIVVLGQESHSRKWEADLLKLLSDVGASVAEGRNIVIMPVVNWANMMTIVSSYKILKQVINMDHLSYINNIELIMIKFTVPVQVI